MIAKRTFVSTSALAVAVPCLRSLLAALLLVCTLPAHAVYWSLFNIEEEASLEARYVTYATLADMLTDSNRVGVFTPSVSGNVARNVVGSGASVPMAPPSVNGVPEPGTLLVVGGGLLVLLAARARCRGRAAA